MCVANKQSEEDETMVDKNTLCEKIRSIYPEIGECGIDIDVAYDETNTAWVVEMKHGDQKLKTFLEPPDVDACVEGRHCIHLGSKISTLISNTK